MLRLAVEGDDGDLVGPALHDLEVLLGDRAVRLLQQQRLLRRDLGAHDLDDLDLEVMATGRSAVKRPGCSSRTKRPSRDRKATLVVLDDSLEPRSRTCAIMISKK